VPPRTCKDFFNFTRIFVFLPFFNIFNLGANKENLLHVTHCIISLLPFSRNSFISRLVQHVMLLTREHVLFCEASGEYVNAKGEYGKMSLHLACKKITMKLFQHYSW
jgi:hypothetical protein